ncbi:putative disease resistance RPP13-like protein 1 [Phragmites australis]|uniref:putative disease resistance RPP13-like protein 1 n=1 Tax=Phragmites australis TaxID=29695 RepID=UPI002D79151D|nr:putative disease resistance RPP13-like protein 1 [Phragmites australis]
MAMFLSAIWSDLTSRSISFLMQRYQERFSRLTVEERLNRLQRLLLRVRVVVEEAEERRITNQAMLHQLSMMRKEMYRGYYTLYTLRCRTHEEAADAEHMHQVSRFFTPSQLNSAKRVRLFGGGSSSGEQEQLQQVLGRLETAIEDASELVVFLSGCPRLYRQPYSMYLVLDKCMFGRQTEMERVVGFLLQPDAPGDENPGVLPIIGPRKVGKSTLLEQACNDERVRDHFSEILFLNGINLRSENMVTIGDAVIKYQNPASHGERVLVIVELDGDRFSKRLDDENIDEGLWRRLYSPYIHHIPRGSKIIVTSRSDKIVSFGTTPPLRLQFLDRDAFWYFFKVRLFGSTDATEHPKLASIAMDMAMELNGCFLNANMFSELLRSNVDARFWSVALTILRELKQKNLFGGAHQVDIWEVAEPVYVPRVNKSSEDFVILDDYETSSADHGGGVATTTMTVQEVLLGTARPRGKFDVLAWRSPIPPHFSYFFGCEIRRRPRHVVAGKKRIQKIGS